METRGAINLQAGRLAFRLLVLLFIVSVLLGAGAAQASTVKIPSSVTKIEEQAFYGDSSLDQVVLPEEITRIESKAFAYSSVKRIYLPAKLNYIAPDAFQGCTNVVGWGTDGTYASGYFDTKSNLSFEHSANPDETPVEYFTFADNDDGSCTLTKYIGTEMDVVIPSRNGEGRVVKNIGYQAFYNQNINSVFIPNTVQRLGYHAFAGCKYLTEVRMSAGLTSLEPYDGSGSIFSGCTSLTEIDIPASVTTIGSSLFYGCSNLTTVTLHEGLTSIGEHAFDSCRNLSEIILPRSMQNIGHEAFYNCGITDVSIPDTVKTIGDSAFYNCDGLTYVEIPDSVTSIGNSAFSDCDALVGLELSNQLTSIGTHAFDSCDSLASLTIPDTVKSIGEYSFNYCTSLASIDLPSGITVINNYLFYNCKSLAYIEIPNDVTSIGYEAFRGCTSLASVDLPSKLKTVSNDAFRGATALTGITFPYGTITIGENVFGGCSALSSVDLADSITSIGSGCFANCTSLNSIVWPLKTKTLSDRVFGSCTSLNEVILHNQVTGIGEYVFSGCLSLSTVEIPSSMASIGTNAFRNSGIDTIDIPGNILTIGANAFYDCDKLTQISFTSNLRSIGNYAFADCDLLDHVILPEGLTTLSEYLFNNCDVLNDITLPSTIKTIGAACFYDCDGMRSISLPNGVQSIAESAFNSCNELSEAVIPASVTSIGNNAFYGCSKLTIYGVSGSAAETEAGKYTYVNFSPIYQTNSETQVSYAQYSGHVETSQGAALKGVSVNLYEGRGSLASATTDDEGNWTLKAPQSSRSYNVNFSSSDYSFSQDSVVVSGKGSQEVGDIVATLNGATDNNLTVTLSENSIQAGELMHAEVSAAGYNKVRLVADGIAYEEYAVENGTADISRTITKAGNRSIQFQGFRNGQWDSISAEQTLVVTAIADLDEPSFSLPATHELLTALTVEWTKVDHADQYTIYLYRDGSRLFKDDVTAPDHQISFSSTLFNQTGNYGVEVIATGKGYSQRSASGTIQVGAGQISITQTASLSDGVINVTVRNTKQKYVMIRVITPDGKEEYITNIDHTAATITGEYECSTGGAYTVQSFAYAMVDGVISEDVIARSTEKKLNYSLQETKISWCRVGDGMASQLQNTTYPVSAKINTRVDSIQATEDGTLLGTLELESETQDAQGYYVYSGSINNSKDSGITSIVFTGFMNNQATGIPRTFTFYMVEKWDTVESYYSISAGTPVYKTPVDLNNIYGYVQQSDRLEVYGEYADLYYAKLDDGKYIYVHKNAVHQFSPSDLAEIVISCTNSALTDYTDPNYIHDMQVSWNIDNFPQGMIVEVTGINAETESLINGISYTNNNGTVSMTVSSANLPAGQIVLTLSIKTSDGLTLKDSTTTFTIYASKSQYDLHMQPTAFESAFSRDANGDVIEELAKVSIDMCDATDHGLTAVQSQLGNYGFSTIVGFDITSGTHTTGHFFGHRTVLDSNGEEIPLFAVLVRGTNGTVKEWHSNFTPGSGTNHYGFSQAESRVIRNLKSYINAHLPAGQTYDNGRYKLWICGHSRGAAVGNLLAAHWNYITTGDVYAYLYATPNNTQAPVRNFNIKNFVYRGDLIPRMVPVTYGYGRNGVTYYKDNDGRINGRNVTTKKDLDTLIVAITALFPKLEDLIEEIDAAFAKMNPESKELLDRENAGAIAQILLSLAGKAPNPQNWGKVIAVGDYIKESRVDVTDWSNAANAHYIDAYRTWMYRDYN